MLNEGAEPAVVKRSELGERRVRPAGVLSAEPKPGAPAVLTDDRKPASTGPVENEVEAAERLARLCRSMAAALAREREELLESLQPGLVDTIMAVADCIVQHEVRLDPTLIGRTVAAAVAKAQHAASITIRVSPADLAVVEGVYPDDPRVRVIADDGISPGGCVLETDWGSIDATIETQLARLRAALSAEVGMPA